MLKQEGDTIDDEDVPLDDHPLGKLYGALDGEGGGVYEGGRGQGERVHLVHQLVELIVQLHHWPTAAVQHHRLLLRHLAA